MKILRVALLVILQISAAWSADPNTRAVLRGAQDKPVTVAEVASKFTSLIKMTDTAVFVNYAFAISCTGPFKEQVDKAREKDGPHTNAAILVFMNEQAARAFRTKAKNYPAGAVVVKQKHFLPYWDSSSKTQVKVPPAGVGGMIKRDPGFDPAHGDWEYFYFEDPKKIDSGKITSCVQCHHQARATDHVFGRWGKKGQ